MKSFLCCIAYIFVGSPHLYCQQFKEINLVKGSDTVFIVKSDWMPVLIGLTTVTDTLLYNHKDKARLGYEVHEIGEDSLTVKRPSRFHDTVICYDKALYPPHLPASRYKSHKREHGKHYVTRLAIDEYEYKTFAYKNITSIRYPPKGSIMQTGCIMCVLFPPMYPFLIHENRVRTVPRTYPMHKWKIFLVTEYK